MNVPDPGWRLNAYMAVAAAAGSMVALHSMKWKEMTWTEISFTLAVGFMIAIFAVPYIAEHWMGLNMSNPREACGVTFIGGTLWNSIMPLAISKVKKTLGLQETVP